MAHGPLSAERCREIFHKAQVGHLGTCRDNIPYAVPLTFVYFRDKVYFHSAPHGRKLDNIAANSRVSFQADDETVVIATGKACTFTTHYYSAMLEGSARVITDPDLCLAALRALVAKYDPEGKAPLLQQEDLAKQDLVVVEINPETIDGVDHSRLPKR
jgi:uncharacterized protein